ncbi:hypothetical protein OS493_039698, partial [Desmophyllum pertusum]
MNCYKSSSETGFTDDSARKLQSLKSKEIENMKEGENSQMKKDDENDNKGQRVEKFQKETQTDGDTYRARR